MEEQFHAVIFMMELERNYTWGNLVIYKTVENKNKY